MSPSDTPHEYDKASDEFPTTMYALKKLAGVEDVWRYCKHVCGNRYCKVFTGDGEDPDEVCGSAYQTENGVEHTCDGRRYKRVGMRLVPNEYIFHFGLAHVLGRWQRNPEWWKFRASKAARNPVDNDFWNGDLVQRMNTTMRGEVLSQRPHVPTPPNGQEESYIRTGSCVEIGYDHYQAYRRKYAFPTVRMSPLTYKLNPRPYI